MKVSPVASSLLALALCTGCAMDRSSTSAMGAGPGAMASSEATLYCKDGAHVPKSVGCAAGVERDMTPPTAAQR